MMRLLYLPLLACAGVPVVGRWLAARSSPRYGAWVLAALTALVAAASLWAAALLAAPLLEDLPWVRNTGDHEPVSDAEAVAGIAVIAAIALRTLLLELRHRRMHRDLRRACGTAAGDLLVLAEPDPYAFVLPGRPGRVVVTEGMLRALTAPQRRVLLAHERAHLAFGHHRFQAVVRFASAINPLLRPVREPMSYLCERWADEHAAHAVGDRRLTADSLAAAALASTGEPDEGSPAKTGQAFSRLGVPQRIAALCRPQREPVIIGGALAVSLAVACLTADADATHALVVFLGSVLR